MDQAGDATNTCLRCGSKQVRNLSASAGLPREDSGKALRLLDDAIALAIGEQENQGVLTLSHHAAVISTFIGNLELVKHNYRQSISSNSENPRALLGLATVARKQGEPELAKDYAARCYKGLIDGYDFFEGRSARNASQAVARCCKTVRTSYLEHRTKSRYRHQ
jgi:hypothetical protein